MDTSKVGLAIRRAELEGTAILSYLKGEAGPALTKLFDDMGDTEIKDVLETRVDPLMAMNDANDETRERAERVYVSYCEAQRLIVARSTK